MSVEQLDYRQAVQLSQPKSGRDTVVFETDEVRTVPPLGGTIVLALRLGYDKSKENRRR